MRGLLHALLIATITAWAAGQAALASPQTPADLVVVMKSERVLYLYQGGRIVGQYPVALGASPLGTKQMVGDNKTPIGAYTLDWRNPNSDFHRSLHISYPDSQDRAQAAVLGVPPGSNIMIHGQPGYDNRLRTGDWTNGCIAVSDAAIDDIWSRVADGTPIHIYP